MSSSLFLTQLTEMSLPVPLRHIPIITFASLLTLGGLWATIKPRGGARAMGLPTRITDSPAGQSVMLLTSARGTAIGASLLVLYAQKQYAAVDVLLIAFGYVGLVDTWVCWREANAAEGMSGRAVIRAVICAAGAYMGWQGWTASGAVLA